jgi:hypothetical protein
MKQIILMSLLLCFIGACKKDTNICDKQAPLDNMPIYGTYSPDNTKHGSINACRNGKNWEASGTAYRYVERDSIFELSGATYTYDGILRESWGIFEVPLQLGKHIVYRYPVGTGGFIGKPTSGFGTFVSDGDVIGDRYRLDESQNNYVEVTTLDTIANKAAGYFELHFVVQQPKNYEENSDEVHFNSGTFEVDIVE